MTTYYRIHFRNNWRLISLFLFIFFYECGFVSGQNTPTNFQNPIIPGFGPDPSICRAGNDYYLVNSSFTWFPGIPIYHSKDLVNWKIIGHGITRPDQVNFDGLEDKYGIWAPTIRYHNGLFYIITTNSHGGGNFYITATDPAGEWSDPVWLKTAEGIDPSLFWDDDGKCYYTGNYWNFKKSWSGQCAIWGKELDLSQQKLVGDLKILSYGHANNAGYTEAPHIYKIDGRYMLITAEGGTNEYHAVTVHHGSEVLGKYSSDRINPVLTHRHLGKEYPIQAVGHADLVQTQNNDWWAVVLGKRMVEGKVLLSRETFLCKVNMEDGTPIFNPGKGKVQLEQERPDLPWTPVTPLSDKDEFDTPGLPLKWHTIRTPKNDYYNIENGKLQLSLLPAVVDSLQHSSILIEPTKHFKFTATTKLSFKTSKANEQAGLIIYRTYQSYYMLLKEKSKLVLIKKDKGTKEIVGQISYDKNDVYLKLSVDKLNIEFSFGESLAHMENIGGTQDLLVIAESKLNKFNGTGVGMYATSNGKKTKNKAVFDWFYYEPKN